MDFPDARFRPETDILTQRFLRAKEGLTVSTPLYEQLDDALLVAAALKDELGAWEAFVRRHGARLLAFIARMTGDEAGAGELWARAFQELWDRRGELAGVDKPATTVFAVAAGLCAKAAGSATRGPRTPARASDLEARAARLNRALQGLAFRERAALCLCYFDNIGFGEADRCLGTAQGESRRLCAEGYAAVTRFLGPGFLREGAA